MNRPTDMQGRMTRCVMDDMLTMVNSLLGVSVPCSAEELTSAEIARSTRHRRF